MRMDIRVDDEMSVLPGGCRLIHLPRIADERGSLSFLQGQESIPFSVERVFWIWDVQPGMTRGGHAHRTCAEVVFPLKGAFTMHIDDGRSQAQVTMNDSTCGILIPAGVWCCLTDFEDGTLCLAVASQPYDAAGYINNHDDFLKEINGRR